MGFLKRILDSWMLGSISPEQLAELLLPMGYTKDESDKDAERRFAQLPADVQARALLKGLENDDDYVREACSERLSSFVGSSQEIIKALLAALADKNPNVRYNAANYFDIGILQTVTMTSMLPVQPAVIIPALQNALNLESDKHAKQALKNAIDTMERLKREMAE